MVINIKKILLFLCLFFLFNTLEVDSNSDKVLVHSMSYIYDEDYYSVYFMSVNSNEGNVYDTETSDKAKTEPLANTYGTKASSILENVDFGKDVEKIKKEIYTISIEYHVVDITIELD